MQLELENFLKGRYIFKQFGKVVAESKNIITDLGEKEILKYLARQQQTYGDNIVLGIGTTSPSKSDEYLEFTTFSVPVQGYFYDDTNNEIVYQAIVPSGVISKIYEAGLATNYPVNLSFNTDTISNNSDLVSDFDTTSNWSITSGVEFYTDPNFSILRAGNDGLQFTVNNNTKVSSLSVDGLFQSYDESDILKIAFNVATNVPANIIVKFYNSSDNTKFYEWELSNISLGYNIKSIDIGSLTPPISTVSLDDIDTIEISVSHTASTVVTFDALRIDHLSDRFGYALISRSVLTTPSELSLEAPIDIEYRLEFDF